MSDWTIAIECTTCHAVNFMPIAASTGQFVCVSCGADLRTAKPKADDQPPPSHVRHSPREST
jgi:hypothetical protein